MTSQALGSDDSNLDQSATSIQILPEPNAGHVTHLKKKLQLYRYSNNNGLLNAISDKNGGMDWTENWKAQKPNKIQGN